MQLERIPNDNRLSDALSEARQRFVESTPQSRAHNERSAASMPGGNTRTVLFYDPYPVVMVGGKGATLIDADGHHYVDFLGEYTAGLYGHSDETIRKALDAALDKGLSLGAHNDLEAILAEAIRARFPAMELLRFTNSGTEANLMALTTARIVTGRQKILVFAGAYHGAVLSFPSHAGSPTNVPFEFVIGDYNDTAGAKRLIKDHGADLAAVIVEPMLGAGGCIPASSEFLATLRTESAQCGAFLILDEVMTSRLGYHGLQGKHDLTPDMTTLGKYIGGGMSFGAFGGKASIMKRFDPRTSGALGHAGTFNNNVLTMSAGIVGLRDVLTEQALADLNDRGDRLRERLNDVASSRRKAAVFTGIGSIMTAHLGRTSIENAAHVSECDPALKELLFFHLLSRGIYLARRLMISLALPIREEDCDRLVDGVAEFFDIYAELLPDRA